jgi:hypothetical protein
VPEIPAYPLLSVLRADDILAALDVHDTSAAGTGTVKKATVSTVTLLQPSTDTSGTTDTANIQQAMAAGQQLGPGTFYVSNLTIDTGQTLAGSGYGTKLQVVSGTTGYGIALAHPATSGQVTLRNFTLNCANVCGGIGLDNTGFEPEALDVPYDPLHSCTNVFVLAALGDGWHLDNNLRGCSFTNCRQYFASGYGWYLGPGAASGGAGCTDCVFTGCTSGWSGSHGLYVSDNASSNMFSGFKVFYAGVNSSTAVFDTTSNGYEILGDWNVFSSCNAQQNALHGWDLNGCSSVSVTACDADTNGTGTSAGMGFNLNGVSYCSLVSCTGQNNTFDTPGAQSYGIQLTGTMTGTSLIGNSVFGVNDGISETSFTDAGGNTIIDYSQLTSGVPAILRGNPGAYLLGQSSAPGVQQYFAGLWANDPTGNGYGMQAAITGAGLTGNLQMAQAGATTSIGSSAAETAVATLSVPANDPQIGSVYKLSGYATAVLGATGPPTITWRIRWGGTSGTVLAVTAALAESASSTGIWEFDATVVFTSTTQATAKLKLGYNLASTSLAPSHYGAPTEVLVINTTATTVTTASTESLVVTAQFSAADSQALAAVAVPERVA